jgi:hypothetical protein
MELGVALMVMISTRVCEVTVPRAGGGISVFYCAAEITGGCTFLKTEQFFAVWQEV